MKTLFALSAALAVSTFLGSAPANAMADGNPYLPTITQGDGSEPLSTSDPRYCSKWNGLRGWNTCALANVGGGGGEGHFKVSDEAKISPSDPGHPNCGGGHDGNGDGHGGHHGGGGHGDHGGGDNGGGDNGGGEGGNDGGHGGGNGGGNNGNGNGNGGGDDGGNEGGGNGGGNAGGGPGSGGGNGGHGGGKNH